jgi:hypothetical protein
MSVEFGVVTTKSCVPPGSVVEEYPVPDGDVSEGPAAVAMLEKPDKKEDPNALDKLSRTACSVCGESVLPRSVRRSEAARL